ncbi:hypothetical protein Zmor_014239 [Zophobas morio]|uniref:Uncharacterized protein n=1 Tax=Zophobas morio TaxID=2755281 RepID=A0AA38IEG0_9CUCU|nr:hypothetical protein Zmor_014239 [Zophobas morio]
MGEALVASVEDDFILGMDLISRIRLTIDPVREVLRLGNEEFKLNQRCTEAKPARLTAYQNCKHCDEVEQLKARFNRKKKALLRWKEDGMERPGWSEISDESPSFKALWAQWDSLRVENGLLKRAW